MARRVLAAVVPVERRVLVLVCVLTRHALALLALAAVVAVEQQEQLHRRRSVVRPINCVHVAPLAHAVLAAAASRALAPAAADRVDAAVAVLVHAAPKGPLQEAYAPVILVRVAVHVRPKTSRQWQQQRR